MRARFRALTNHTTERRERLIHGTRNVWLRIQCLYANRRFTECYQSQKDTELSGSCSADQGTVKISGKVDGKKATWTYKGESPGGPVTVVYNGTVDSADKMSGKVTAVEFSVEGDFTATRVK
jgi:hypothetical protein